jgi:hypothetical protein
MIDRPSTLLAVVLLPLIYLSYHIWCTYARLKDVPGPFWARFTNLQRVLWVKTGRSHEIYQTIHEHEDFVRVGPNMVSISDPAAIPDVYPMRPGFPKVGIYLPIGMIYPFQHSEILIASWKEFENDVVKYRCGDRKSLHC